MSVPYVVCVILNFNRRAETLECLASLAKSTYENLDILVLDIHSSDGTEEAIRRQYPKVRVLQLAENLGYAGNNNIGIGKAMEMGAEWVFILNEDTVLHPACLEKMVEAAAADPRCGAVGPMVYHYDEPATIQSAGGMLGPYWQSIHLGKDEPDNGQWTAVHAVEWLTGCSILVRGQTIAEVGGIDERFFMYWEETEWCLRMKEAGWRILHVPEAKLWHKGVKRNFTPKPAFTYYDTRNRLLMISKHHAPFRVWAQAGIEILRTIASWSLKPKWRDKLAYRDAMWQGLQDFLSHKWGKQRV